MTGEEQQRVTGYKMSAGLPSVKAFSRHVVFGLPLGCSRRTPATASPSWPKSGKHANTGHSLQPHA